MHQSMLSRTDIRPATDWNEIGTSYLHPQTRPSLQVAFSESAEGHGVESVCPFVWSIHA